MIHNIHFLHPEPVNLATQAKAALEQALIYAHRRGEHPYGRMRRACPLCQLNK